MAESEPLGLRPLRRRFGRYIRSRSRFRRRLRAALDRIADLSEEVFVFGGLLRDLATRAGRISPRDVDVVISGADLDALAATFGRAVRRRTRFGGLVLVVEGWRVDVWDLHDTWAFRTNVVREPSFENLPRTTFLDVEAIAVEYRAKPGKARRVFEHGFFSALAKGQVEINLEANPFQELAVARALVTASAMGYSIGPSLRRFILAHTSTTRVEGLIEAQLDHYRVVRRHSRTLLAWLRHLQDANKHGDESIVLPSAGGVQLNLWDTLNWDALLAETTDLD